VHIWFVATTILKAIVLLGSLSASITALILLYKATSFFEAESVHKLLMALGDARPITSIERLKIKLVWIPFLVLLSIAGCINVFLVLSCFRRDKAECPRR
jgi:hypothetical protein